MRFPLLNFNSFLRYTVIPTAVKVGKAGAFLQSACFLLPKADRAEAGRTSGAGLPQPLQRDIPEAVRADRGADRFLRHPIGDQRLLAADVGAVMAGAAEGR